MAELVNYFSIIKHDSVAGVLDLIMVDEFNDES